MARVGCPWRFTEGPALSACGGEVEAAGFIFHQVQLKFVSWDEPCQSDVTNQPIGLAFDVVIVTQKASTAWPWQAACRATAAIRCQCHRATVPLAAISGLKLSLVTLQTFAVPSEIFIFAEKDTA